MSQQDSVCFYGSKAFASDVTFQKHGATCQQCSTQGEGSWIDRLQGCERARQKEVSGVPQPSQLCTDVDGLTYSEGAIVENRSRCQRCQNHAWYDLDQKAFCKH
jgi:hypothetical protein